MMTPSTFHNSASFLELPDLGPTGIVTAPAAHQGGGGLLPDRGVFTGHVGGRRSGQSRHRDAKPSFSIMSTREGLWGTM